MTSRARRSWWRVREGARHAARRLAWRLSRGLPQRRRRIVLAYHTVSDAAVAAYPANVLSLASFVRQLAAIEASGRPVLPLSEVVRGAAGDAVALTFDDGYASCLEVVAPLLEEREWPATFFVCPGFADRELPKWDDLLHAGLDGFDKRVLRRPWPEVRELVERVMADRGPELVAPHYRALLDWDGVGELARRGFEIGSHSLFHSYLSAQEEGWQRHELAESKRRLEERLGHPVERLAYPFGAPPSFDSTSVALAREVGYSSAVAVSDRYVEAAPHPWAVPRFGVSTDRPWWEIELMLTGRWIR